MHIVIVILTDSDGSYSGYTALFTYLYAIHDAYDDDDSNDKVDKMNNEFDYKWGR